MKSSVTKTDRSGVFAAIQRAARSCGSPSATSCARMCHVAMSTGDSAHTSSTADDRPRPPAREQPAGEDRDRDPHDLEVLVHVEFDGADDDDVRDDEQGDHPGDEEPAPRPAAREERGDDREQDGDAEVGQVEERGRGRPVADPRLAPAEHEPERPDVALPRDGAGDERRGEDDRREEQERVAPDRAGPPRAGRQDVQRDDQVGRREGEELERREERGQHAREQDAQRPPVEARDDEQDDRHEAGQPERRRPVRQEPRPEDRGDLEERPAVRPGVVVRQAADEADDVLAARDEVADEPDPAEPATEADEDRRDRRQPPSAGQPDGKSPDDEREDGGEQRARREVDADEVDARRRSR